MTIGFNWNFRKSYRKIPLKIRRQLDERFRFFVQEPYHPMLNNHPLAGDRLGQWSINITGDLRAVYIFRDKTTIVFIDIDTHSNLYK